MSKKLSDDIGAYKNFRLRAARLLAPNATAMDWQAWQKEGDNPLSQALKEWGRLEHFSTVGEALTGFSEWLHERDTPPKKTPPKSPMIEGEIVVTCKVMLSNGAELKTSHVFETIGSEADEKIMHVAMFLHVALKKTAKAMNAQIITEHQTSSNMSAGDLGQTQVVFSEMVVVSDEHGEKVVKLRGGEFSKFGVRVYPEVLRTIGIEYSDLPLGISTFERTGIVQTGEGKAAKVLRFI